MIVRTTGTQVGWSEPEQDHGSGEMIRLTAKRERFCQEMITPKATQSKAYRVAFNARGMKASTIHREACILMKDPKVTARLAELRRPALDHVQTTREEWVLELEKMLRGDVRKMFDPFGKLIPLQDLGENEAAIIEAMDCVERYTRVKTANGGTEDLLIGSTKRYKLTQRMKVLVEFGKARGWYAEVKTVGSDMTLEELVLRSYQLEKEGCLDRGSGTGRA